MEDISHVLMGRLLQVFETLFLQSLPVQVYLS